MSYRLNGVIDTKLPTAWLGAEFMVTYVDGAQEWLSIRRDSKPVGTVFTDELQYQTFTLKDKDVKSIAVTC
ncbi:hypothetical protein, partial [Bacillus cereus]|uniref:hypothetical protein n=1 Tax=Bacillus cereus TaxID=1396 RepID=UPI0018F680A0